jgi:DNA-binding response OmpR family regulator
MRVLIVEDEWLIADSMAIALRACGYEIVGPVPCVDAAYRIIEASRPDAAVLDIALKDGENSYPIARRLAADGIRFAFMSGYAHDHLPHEFRGTPLVSKPVSIEDLTRTVAELLASA